MPVKFQGYTFIIASNIVTSRLHEIFFGDELTTVPVLYNTEMD